MIVALVDDLLTFTRIEGAARAAGIRVARADGPAELPPPADVELLLVDCGTHLGAWGAGLAAWRSGALGSPRIVAFGPHTDLDAHRAVRELGIGPMWARSRLMRELPALMAAAAR